MIDTPNITDPQSEVDLAAERAARERDERFARIHRERVAQAAERAARGQPSTPKESAGALLARWQAGAVAASDGEAKREPAPAPESYLPAQRSVAERFRDAMIPERFRAATLCSYVPKTPSQESALKATRVWLDRVRAGEPAMLALIGLQGTGKSHLLYAAANALLENEIKIYARPWYLLADELRYGGSHPLTGSALDASDVRRVLLSPPWSSRVWLLDEVRPTSGTAFDDTELTKLACLCYDRNYPALITSNVNPLADVMGAPAASRFRQVVVVAPDARQS